MAKCIVTGGAGFIGSNLCRELVTRGHEVYSVDDYSSGYKKNLDDLDIPKIICDVSDYENMHRVFERVGKVDVVFHQAASKKNICLNNPVRDMEVNVKGAFNVAYLCRKFGIKLVHASTGSVYGESMGLQNESHPNNPVSYYGVSKLAGEKYVAMMLPNASILRYFHVYGASQEDKDDLGGVIAIWLRRIKEGLPIVLNGDGSQLRTFTYVGDVVEANILAAEKGTGVYNVSSGFNYTLNELIGILQRDYNIRIDRTDWLPGDIKEFNVCNARIKNLGVRFCTLEEGLKKFAFEVS
jgi:UDP-glucose 4-epimerase